MHSRASMQPQHTPLASQRLPLRQAGELLGYVCVSAGMAVAASSYMVLGLIARSLDARALVLAIGAAFAMCLMLALAMGEMSSRFPSAPGIRTYVRRAFGERASLFFTYLMMLIIPLVAAVEIKVFLAALLPAASVWQQCTVACALVLLLAGLNLGGLDLPRTAQTVVFVALVAVSLFFSARGLGGAVSVLPVAAPPAMDARGLQSASPSLGALGEGVGLAVFLFVGFEWVAPMARSPRAAAHTVPWSMVLAVALLGVMYLAFGLALKRSLPAAVLQASAAPHVSLGEHLLGMPGRWAAQALSLFALLTTLNAGMMGATRLVYGLAREQALGRQPSAWLARISPSGVPTVAVLTLAGVSLLCALWVIVGDHATAVASAGAGLYTLVYAVFAATHVRLRQLPGPRPPFRARVPTPVYAVLAAMATGVAASTLGAAVQGNFQALVALLAFGALAALMSHRVARRREARAPTFPPTAAQP